jgi:oxygen-independent coproporphyrinogen-3 oxidase
MEQEAAELLEAAGYRRYEVSAWARPESACRHNLNYWNFGDYLGLGAGAHGKLTLAGGRVLRRRRRRRPAGYLEGERVEGEEWPEGDTLAFEFMLNALRLVDGFSLALFEARTGLSAACVLGRLEQARQQGLMEEQPPGQWRPTALGFRFLNDLQGHFLPPAVG